MGSDGVAVVASLLKERNLKEGETSSADDKVQFQDLKEKYEKEGPARLWDTAMDP